MTDHVDAEIAFAVRESLGHLESEVHVPALNELVDSPIERSERLRRGWLVAATLFAVVSVGTIIFFAVPRGDDDVPLVVQPQPSATRTDTSVVPTTSMPVPAPRMLDVNAAGVPAPPAAPVPAGFTTKSWIVPWNDSFLSVKYLRSSIGSTDIDPEDIDPWEHQIRAWDLAPGGSWGEVEVAEFPQPIGDVEFVESNGTELVVLLHGPLGAHRVLHSSSLDSWTSVAVPMSNGEVSLAGIFTLTVSDQGWAVAGWGGPRVRPDDFIPDEVLVGQNVSDACCSYWRSDEGLRIEDRDDRGILRSRPLVVDWERLPFSDDDAIGNMEWTVEGRTWVVAASFGDAAAQWSDDSVVGPADVVGIDRGFIRRGYTADGHELAYSTDGTSFERLWLWSGKDAAAQPESIEFPVGLTALSDSVLLVTNYDRALLSRPGSTELEQIDLPPPLDGVRFLASNGLADLNGLAPGMLPFSKEPEPSESGSVDVHLAATRDGYAWLAFDIPQSGMVRFNEFAAVNGDELLTRFGDDWTLYQLG